MKGKDTRDRSELKEEIEKSDLNENLKKKLLDYAEELENGRLKQLLDSIKKKISEN